MQGVSSVEGTLFSFERKKPPCKFIWEERRMKKFWIVLLSLLLSLACVMGFAACTERPDDETGGSVQPGDPDPDKPHEHNFGEWVVTIPATCTEAGEEQRTCSCGETETRTVAALGHDYVNGVCTRCEDMITATDDSYFTFTELEDGTYSISWAWNTDFPAEVVIPWEYNGKPVTQVEEEAFDSCDSLKSVTIPSSVTSIGYGAFGLCTSLTSVTISSGVTSIGVYAFASCYSLTSITIPNGVTSIGDGAFRGCDSLTSVAIGDDVAFIGIAVFEGCRSLTNITVSSENRFYHNKGDCLIETESKTLIWGSGTSVIPDDGSVTSIGVGAYYECENLTSIVIPDGVTSIEYSAFGDCVNLASVTIPDSVTFIGKYAFSGCTGLTSIIIPNSVTSIGDYAFSHCYRLTSVTIGDGVTSIGYGAFGYCDSLTSVTIPDSVTSIGEYAFAYCDSLTSVTIGDGVTSIAGGAFCGCNSLTNIVIPDSVTSIGIYAFSGCTGLTSITIPDSVTSIVWSAFEDCTGLTSVTFANPNGWSVGGKAIPAADLADPATAAEYLRETYNNYEWTRE